MTSQPAEGREPSAHGSSATSYSRAEKIGLVALAGLGLLGVNGAFLYGASRPELLRAALENPVSLAFMVEATALMVALAYLLTRWGVTRLRWTWFILLSLLGSLAFALPVAVLYGAGASGGKRG